MISRMHAILSASAAQMLLQSDGAPVTGTVVRGHVEVLDSRLGLQGWIAGESPHHSPELELRIDGVAVMTCVANSHRPDIWLPSDAATLSGFVFPVEDLSSLAARTDISPQALVQVGPSRSPHYLSSNVAWTFADLQALLAADAGADTEVGIGLALPAELRRLTMLARRSFHRPARQDSRKRIGVIEFLAPIPGYGFIVGGWTDMSSPRTVATVLVADGRRFAGGLCCVMRSRPDLPAGAMAFVGVLSLQEKLELNRAPHWSLHFAGKSGNWLSSVQPMRILEAKVASAELQQTVASGSDPRGKELEQFVRGFLPWGTLNPGVQEGGVKVALDDCVIAPGFGVFVRGWVLSAVGVVIDVTARLGDALFHLDPSSLAIGARKDLGAVFPAYGDRLEHASMTALMRGTATPDHQGPWLLRLRFDDGREHIHPVAGDRVRRIDAAYDLSQLQTIFPGFESAAWLPELVEAVYGIPAIDESAVLHWERGVSCSTALILAVSPVRSHQIIALESFDRNIGQLEHGAGAVLMIPSSMPAGTAATWLAAICERHPAVPIAACRLGAGRHPWPALEAVLEHCGIQHFVFIGPSVLLTDAGAEAAAGWLASGEDGPTFLAIETLLGGRAELVHETAAFGWRTPALRAHCTHAPPVVGYVRHDKAIPGATRLPAQPGNPHALHMGSRDSPLVDAINQRMLASHAVPGAGMNAPTPDPAPDSNAFHGRLTLLTGSSP